VSEALRQEKLLAARAQYEEVLARHPHLRQIEERLISLHIDKALHRGSVESELAELQRQRQDYLIQHGIPADFAQPKWDCPLCLDTGIVEGRSCRCQQQRILERRFQGARLPRRLRDQTFDRFSLEWYSERETPLGYSERENAARVLYAAQRFVAEVMEDLHSATGLFISGRSGLGKTFLCSAICHALAENGIVPLYMVFSDLIAEIRASFEGGSSFSEDELIQMAREVPVLVLDDLGAEHVTDFSVSRLFDIVNYRRNERLPLVISSNLTLGSEIAQRYSERINSRLGEICKPLMLWGTDIRVQQRNRRADQRIDE
jgi:DNA replication protein DnaC